MNFIFKKFLVAFFEKQLVTITASESLKGKVVVVTGGSKGIGAAITKVLETKNATCIRIARSFSEDEKQAGKGTCIIADVTKKAEIEMTVVNIVKQYGKIDILVNNVGMFLDSSLEQISENDFNNMVNVNIKSVFLFSQAVLPYMKKRGCGLIINVGSKISHNTQVAPKKTLYAMSKYAVEGFSFALNREVKQFGVKVTCIMPGTVSTFFSKNSKNFLSPLEVGNVVSMIAENEEIDFESIVFKSINQNI